MAQNEPQRKETPLGPSPNSPSLLFEYQCRSGKLIRLANRIESKKNRFGSENRIESKLFLPEMECSRTHCMFKLVGRTSIVASTANLVDRWQLLVSLQETFVELSWQYSFAMIDVPWRNFLGPKFRQGRGTLILEIPEFPDNTM